MRFADDLGFSRIVEKSMDARLIAISRRRSCMPAR